MKLQYETISGGLQRRSSVLAAAADAASDFQRAAATGKRELINHWRNCRGIVRVCTLHTAYMAGFCWRTLLPLFFIRGIMPHA